MDAADAADAALAEMYGLTDSTQPPPAVPGAVANGPAIWDARQWPQPSIAPGIYDFPVSRKLHSRNSQTI
jgi:hypothetical protein